ncbi:MAG: ABC transporter ATP-binding protein [Thermoprotei archaeon]|nr:MAG: ABC transporter ATP-binding protein [Thermoprotei archaeon]
MTKVRLENVTKVYGPVIAVNRVNLEIEHGELFTLLGPSGCGKTTTLRIIAGFEVPEEGKVFFDDDDVTFMKPYHRGTAMVFQNYALWPHMTVYDNIAYGLRIRKIPESEIRERVKQVLELVKLEGLENRFPLQLSGGQQQRVALARALVVEPRVLLLDEPLSNLDAKLRIEMREEIKRIQKKLGITTIYVTHDQIEAMSISDRVAIMNEGRIYQVGTPKEVYFYPKSIFVANFIGRSNILYGKVTEKGDTYAKVYIDELKAELEGLLIMPDIKGKAAVVIRPENIIIDKGLSSRTRSKEYNVLEGKLDFQMFVGEKIEARVKVGDASLIAYIPNILDVSLGADVTLYIHRDNVRILSPK